MSSALSRNDDVATGWELTLQNPPPGFERIHCSLSGDDPTPEEIPLFEEVAVWLPKLFPLIEQHLQEYEEALADRETLRSIMQQTGTAGTVDNDAAEGRWFYCVNLEGLEGDPDMHIRLEFCRDQFEDIWGAD